LASQTMTGARTSSRAVELKSKLIAKLLEPKLEEQQQAKEQEAIPKQRPHPPLPKQPVPKARLRPGPPRPSMSPTASAKEFFSKNILPQRKVEVAEEQLENGVVKRTTTTTTTTTVEYRQ